MRDDMATAMKWFLLSGAAGFPRAMGQLGFMYEEGQGCRKSYEKAVFWWQKVRSRNESRSRTGRALTPLEPNTHDTVRTKHESASASTLS